MACHLTQDYPDWWDGFRVPNGSYNFVAVGITLKSTADILQEKLFGTADCRDMERMGTGFIPRDAIIFDPMEKDGSRIVSCSIRNKSGGTNTLKFFAAGDHKKIMGITLMGAWIDESDKTQCGALYSQCATRTLTTNGFVIQTFTPENGIDDVVKKFKEANAEDSDHLKLHIASMYDAHVDRGGHITDAMIEKIKAACPEFEWECRIFGIPSAGSGAVFPLKDSEIRDDVEIKPAGHWPIICSFDIGRSQDPTVASIITRDPYTNTIHLLKQGYLQGDIYSKDPQALAKWIKEESGYPNVLVVSPHDGGVLAKHNPETYAKKLADYGINVYRLPFRNPQQSQLTSDSVSQSKALSVRDVETGLREMRTWMKEGKFKIHRDCVQWFKEKQTYYYLDKGEPVDKDNHCIDSSRYGFMSILGSIYCTVDEARGFARRKAMVSNVTF